MGSPGGGAWKGAKSVLFLFPGNQNFSGPDRNWGNSTGGAEGGSSPNPPSACTDYAATRGRNPVLATGREPWAQEPLPQTVPGLGSQKAQRENQGSLQVESMSGSVPAEGRLHLSCLSPISRPAWLGRRTFEWPRARRAGGEAGSESLRGSKPLALAADRPVPFSPSGGVPFPRGQTHHPLSRHP